MLGEIWEMFGISNFFYCFFYDIWYYIDILIIKCLFVNLFIVMCVMGVKEEKIIWIDDIFLILIG